MGVSFNPKMLAQDVAKGLVYLNPHTLKKYRPEEFKAMLDALMLIQREIRAKQIPQEETAELKERNRQLQHVNQAITIINSYIKQHNIRV